MSSYGLKSNLLYDCSLITSKHATQKLKLVGREACVSCQVILYGSENCLHIRRLDV